MGFSPEDNVSFFGLGFGVKPDPTTPRDRAAIAAAVALHHQVEGARRDATTAEDREVVRVATERYCNNVTARPMTPEEEAAFAAMERPGALTRKT
jgi:hypothetical protein